MAGLSPTLGSPVSYTLKPQEVEVNSQIKVYDRKMTDDNVFRNSSYFDSDLKAQSEMGFRVKPHNIENMSSDGKSPDTAMGSMYLKPVNMDSAEKMTPPKSVSATSAICGTSPL